MTLVIDQTSWAVATYLVFRLALGARHRPLRTVLTVMAASLVPSYVGKADTAIAALSSFLRASLTVTRGDETALEDELRLVDAYLEIESLRF